MTIIEQTMAFKGVFPQIICMMSLLWEFCESGSLPEVRAALARGEDVNSKDEDGETGLMWAVSDGYDSIVELLLEQPTLDLNCTDNLGDTALHYAAEFHNVEAVRMLLADPRLNTANQKNDDDLTPVMHAMDEANTNVLRELVGHPSVDLSEELVGRWTFL